jgi:NADPH:quinone reductase-like Zn-dependent oxidoreductase
MKAIMIKKYGGPEVLEIVDVPAPKPKANEVIVQVKATSVNPVDWFIRDGKATSFVKLSFPAILGCDLAGTVVEVGEGVRSVAVGDDVFAMMPQDYGAHAERVALAESLVVKKPAELSMTEAAAIPVVAMTALNGLRAHAQVRAGEHVLVNGASGGVGLAAVQIAKVLGAKVTAVCSAQSFDLVKSLGADIVIDYKQQDFTKGDVQYDVIFDCVGNAPWSACQNVLRGRRIHVTTMPHPKTFIRQFFNVFTKTKVHALITTGSGPELAYIKGLVEKGALKPIIDKVFPMSDVARAQEYSKAGRAKGKIVLEL